MSKVEMKVGEWYEQKDGERWQCIAEYPKSIENKCRFICCTLHGDLYTFRHDGSFYEDAYGSMNDIVRHLPGCTGFNWQEPKIPEGWRRLADDEILTIEDKYLQADGKLHCVFSYAGRTVKQVVSNWGLNSNYPYAIVRKIEEPKPEPKFKVGDVVYATKPKDVSQAPHWLGSMDKLEGVPLKVVSVDDDYPLTCECNSPLSDIDWAFRQDWLSKEPLAARYRPFANDEEYAPHFDRPVKRARKGREGRKGWLRLQAFDQEGVWKGDDPYKKISYSEMYANGWVFADTNEPFGVKIS